MTVLIGLAAIAATIMVMDNEEFKIKEKERLEREARYREWMEG